MKVESVTLEKKYHDAVEHWRRHYLKDYDSLLENWEKYFPQDEPFCLCAKMEIGMPEDIYGRRARGREEARAAEPAERGRGPAPARHHPRAGFDRIRLDPAARRHAGARAGRRGPLLGAARHGRGAAPRLPDVPPAAVAGLERGLGRRQGRGDGRGDPVDADRHRTCSTRSTSSTTRSSTTSCSRRSSTASASTSSPCRRCAPTSRWPTACRRCCARRRSTWPPA